MRKGQSEIESSGLNISNVWELPRTITYPWSLFGGWVLSQTERHFEGISVETKKPSHFDGESWG